MSTPSGPQDSTDPPPGGGGEGPAYYRPGPSSGYYPQYPQNPFGPGSSGVPPQYSYRPGTGNENVTYPYGGPFPAGTGPQFVGDTAPAQRPRSMVTALVLLLVPPVFFLVAGLVLTLVPLDLDSFPPEAGVDQALAQSGLSEQQLLSAMRTFGVVVAVIAVLYAVLAVVSFMGRMGALVTLTVLTILFDLFLLLTLVSAAANPAGAILPVIVLATSVAGVWLMFTGPARAWFAAKRR